MSNPYINSRTYRYDDDNGNIRIICEDIADCNDGVLEELCQNCGGNGCGKCRGQGAFIEHCELYETMDCPLTEVKL